MDCRPRVAARFRLTSWCRHRDRTLSSLIGRIALVKLTCPWDTDAKKAVEPKTARYADLKTALRNEGLDHSLYLIKVGVWGHILKLVKDRLCSFFRAWVPAGHRSGIGQMMKDVCRISLVCSFFLFQPRNGPVWSFPRLVTQHIALSGLFHIWSPTHRWGANGFVNSGSFRTLLSPYPRKKTKNSKQRG
jgi:hypothetical protein